MVDYAISAVGQASGNERLLNSGPSNEALRFETIGSRGHCSIWDTNLNASDQIRIIQEASSSDAQLKTASTPWDDFSARVENKLNRIQDDWNQNSEKIFNPKMFSFDIPRNADMSPRAFMKSMLKNFQSVSLNSLKIQRVLMGSQLKIAMVSSIGGTIKTSISALFRQQG
jgi:hypothetical protein